MKLLIIVCVLITAVVVLALVAGLFLPAKHSVTRSIVLRQKPEAVFAALGGVDGVLNDPATVLSAERLPAVDGRPTARYTMKWGHIRMIVTEVVSDAPARLVLAMAREGGGSLGTWTYRISPEGDHSRLALTEDGDIANPLFRLIGRMRGLDSNIVASLTFLAGRFGEQPEIDKS